jgi:branched-chain amino acid transport system substrate-binding protein
MRLPDLRKVSLAIAAAVLLAACGGGGDDTAAGGGGGGEEGPLRLGLLLALTGPAAPFGIPERDAIRWKVENINAEGGIDGRQIEVFEHDTQTNPTEAARGARALMVDDEVHAIIGATTGSASLAVGPIAMQNQVPIVAPNGTIPVTDPDNEFYDWVFRSSINDLIGVEAAFDQAVERGGNRMAIFYQEDAYGIETAERIQELADEAGDVEIVETASAPLTATEVVAQATRLNNANPDVIFMQTSSPTLGGAFVRAHQQLGMEQEVWGPGGITTQGTIDAAQGGAEGVLYSAGGVGWDQPTENQKEFMEAYAADGKGEPQGFGEAIGITALNAILVAVESIDGELTGQKVRDALAQACPFETLLRDEGCYAEDDHDGLTTEAGAVLTVKDGKWVTVE